MAPPRFKAPALKLLCKRSGFLCGLDWAYGTSLVQMLLTSARSRRLDPAFKLLHALEIGPRAPRDWAKGTSSFQMLLTSAQSRRATLALEPLFIRSRLGLWHLPDSWHLRGSDATNQRVFTPRGSGF